MKNIRSGTGPTMLDFEIFLTNRCNLACAYCSSRHLRAEKETKSLSFGQLKSFVDLVSRDRRIRRHFTGTTKVLFSGGEPLLEFGLIKKTVDYIRGNRLDFKLAVMTNGTLLTRDRLDYFLRNGVYVGISLDGDRERNDRHRKFAGGGGSVFDRVMRNLGGGFPSARHMDRCRAMATLTPRTIGALPDIVRFFRHELGLKKLSVELEAYELWDQAAIGRFRTALRSMISGFLASLAPGADAGHAEAAFAEFPLLQNKHFRDDAQDPGNSLALTLHYDGCFYPSPDLAAGPAALASRYRVGDVSGGIDVEKTGRLLAPMLAEIARKCAHPAGPRSPFEGYAWGVANGFTQAELDRFLKNASDINGAFHEETRDYLQLFRLYRRMHTTPGFGDFTHSPPYAGDKEARSFRLVPDKRAGTPELRRRLDYFLYSPGAQKELVVEAGSAAGAVSEDIDGIILYALAKAKRLGKRLAVRREHGGGRS